MSPKRIPKSVDKIKKKQNLNYNYGRHTFCLVKLVIPQSIFVLGVAEHPGLVDVDNLRKTENNVDYGNG